MRSECGLLLVALGGCAHDPDARGVEIESKLASTVSVISVRSEPYDPAHRAKEPRTLAKLEWPVAGVLSSPFGMRDGKPHEGIDIAVAEGTPVHAAMEGVVAYAGDRVRGYGKVVLIEHPEGLVTVYAHNSELLVRERAAVARGQVIARSGQTGHATAPHVHFEVRERFRPADPLKFLTAANAARGAPADGSTRTVSTRSHP